MSNDISIKVTKRTAPNGTVYDARWRDAEGVQRKRTARLSKDARAAALKAIAQAAADGADAAGPRLDPSTTVLAYAEQWVCGRNYRASSLSGATTNLGHLRRARLGGMRLTAVLPSDVQVFVTDLTRTHDLAPRTVRNLVVWLKGIFCTAAEDGVIPRSPFTSRLRLPDLDRVTFVVLTVAEVHQLADAMPERYRAAVILQAATGLRVSELLGLKVADIDFLRLGGPTLTVERQLARSGADLFAEPKTKSSKRNVPPAADVVPVLSEHVRMFPAPKDDLLFSTEGGFPVRQDRYSAAFKVAVAAAGLPASTTPHDLRHHFASTLLGCGMPPVTVAKYMGHSTAAVLLSTYAHCLPSADDSMRAALDAIWAAQSAISVPSATGLTAL